jgi:feruloyl esterase
MKTIALILFAMALGSQAFGNVSCDALATQALPNTTITAARVVPAGAFDPPGEGNAANREFFKNLPAFCRVTATLKPSADSDIKIEVWLPVSGWNGKLQSVGNGGWAGVISYPALASAVAAGYASASTDTGHVGGSGSFALGHPEKLTDYNYRSVHEMTDAAKAMISSFYGYIPRRAYWNGCSTGGRQGLMEAQRYPEDYDAIIAGAPANYMTHLHLGEVWMAQAVHQDETSYIPPAKYSLIHDAVLQACDALDGVKDGVIEDPTRCHFDPKVLECKGADGPSCLSSAQVEAARKIYAGPSNPRTKAQIFPGLQPGSELGWGEMGGPQPLSIPIDTFKYVVFKDPGWDYQKLNFDSDVALADKNEGMNAINPNLKEFFGHEGKLMMYHGWSDQRISPLNTINYYKSVQAAMGGAANTSNSLRLFMVPGMMHCRGGDGPNTFDAVSLLDQWLEAGKAPDQMIASHSTAGKVDRTRPLCPYPQVATYKGSGSTDDAANFVCKADSTARAGSSSAGR